MQFTLEQVRHVLALARFRHFGRAAEHLNITQPALSRSIKALETRFGCQFFHRSPRGVRPTADGARFLEHGSAVLEAALRLQSDVSRISPVERDELSLACALYPAELSLGPALGRVAEEFPGLRLSVETADWSRAHSLLSSGESELYFGEVGAEPEFESRTVNRQPLYLVVRHGHPLASLRNPSQDDVFAHPWVGPRIPPRGVPIFIQHQAQGRVDERSGWFSPAVVSASLSASLMICRSTDCVACVPLSVAQEHLAAGTLALVRFRAPWFRTNYGFSWRRGEPLSRVVKRFMDIAEEKDREIQVRERALFRHYRCDQWNQPEPVVEA